MSNTRRLTALPAKKPRTKAGIIDFLSKHFRYATGNGMGPQSSYAVNIKVRRLHLTNEESQRVYEAMEAENAFEESGFLGIFEAFGINHGQTWQIGTNGRSSGYAVLYSGHREQSQHKSRCTECRQLNFQEATPESNRCGRCGQNARVNLTNPIYNSYVSTSSVDAEQDYEDWDTDRIRERFNLVWDFDLTVEDACQTFLDWAMAHKVEERTVSVPHRIKVAVPRG